MLFLSFLFILFSTDILCRSIFLSFTYMGHLISAGTGTYYARRICTHKSHGWHSLSQALQLSPRCL